MSPSFSGEHHPANSAAAIHQAPPDAIGQLIDLALSSAHLVIAPDETAWAVIDQAEHREVHQLGSAGFKQWLLQRQALPRLVDFALWATACEGAFTRQGTILAALRSNREDTPDRVIDGDAVLMALLHLIDTHDGYWIGRADELLSALKACVPEGSTRSRAWPANPQTLSNRLSLARAQLRRHGLTIRKGKSGGVRFIEVRRQ